MDDRAVIVPIPVGISLNDAEKALIEATLNSRNGNVRAAAKILGITWGTLYAKIARHKISRGQATGQH